MSLVEDNFLETSPVARPPRRWLPVALALAASLVGGIGGGAATTLYLQERQQPPAWQHMPGPPPGPPPGPEQMLSHLAQKLSLNQSQTDELRTVYADHFRRLEQIRTEFQPRFEAEFADVQKRIDGVLNEEQREKWQEMMRDFRRKMPPKWGPPHKKRD